MRDFELKLLLIPVVFVLIRAWGTIRYFLTTRWSRDTLHTYCASADYYPAFLALQVLWLLLVDAFVNLICLQAFGDPAQGWANCLLYCLFTKKIRERLFPCCREQNDADLEMTYTDDDSGPSYRGSANIQNNPKDVEPCRAGDLQAAGSRDPLLTDEEHWTVIFPLPLKQWAFCFGKCCSTTTYLWTIFWKLLQLWYLSALPFW